MGPRQTLASEYLAAHSNSRFGVHHLRYVQPGPVRVDGDGWKRWSAAQTWLVQSNDRGYIK